MAEYINTKETAVFVRKALKSAFPGFKFSVRIDRYSGGSSIDIRWTDGPSTEEVDLVVKPFNCEHFDGMIDMRYHSSVWLLPDGTVKGRICEGTVGSRGSVDCHRDPKPHPDARLVSFHGGISTQRNYSNETDLLVAKEVEEHTGYKIPININGEVDYNKRWDYYARDEFNSRRYDKSFYTKPESSKQASKLPSESFGELNVTYNEEKDGIELRFDSKPPDVVLGELKAAGWRWSRRGYFWYNRDNEASRGFVEYLKSGFQEEVYA